VNRKIIFASAVVVVICSLLIIMPLLASNSKWTYLAPEDCQLIAMADNTPVVYIALQDKDKKKISEAVSGTFVENGVEVFEEGKAPMEFNYDESGRPDIVPSLKFKKITPENALADVPKEVFEVSYQDGEETKKAKIANLTLDGKTILASADPECFGLIPSPDHTKGIFYNEKGLWLLQAGKQGASKVSKDKYNGKSYNDLVNELKKKLAGSEGPAIIWWNDNPIFSPDSSKIVYTTNRDCVESGGSSIWLYDLATGEEQPLIRNTGGEHYRCKGWLNTKYIIYQKLARGSSQYFIADVEGNSQELKLDAEKPDILSVYSEMIAYTNESRDICVIKVDLENNPGSVNVIYEKPIEGVLRQTMPPAFSATRRNFSPDGSKLAYLYAPDSNETVRHLVIVDLNTKEETFLKEVPSKDGVRTVFYDFDWLDNQRLLIRVSRNVDGMNEISSWVYSEGVAGDENY